MAIFSRRKLLASATAGVGSVILGAAASATSAAPHSLKPEAAPLSPLHVLTFSAADFNPTAFDAGSSLAWSQDPDGLLRGNAAAFITFHAPVGLPVGATVKQITWHTNANAGVDLEFVRYRPKTQTATSIATTMTAGSTGIGEFS